MTDTDLLIKAKKFDLDVLAGIYDEYSPGLYRYAYRLLGDPDLAEDCVAEVFNRFLGALSSGGGPHNYLQAYLYRVAHNWITDQYRRQPVPSLPLKIELVGDPDGNPAAVVSKNLEAEQVRDMLRLLTPDQRQVIVLKYFEECSNKETAQALGKPVSAVKSLQHRGLQALRRMLTMKEDEHERD